MCNLYANTMPQDTMSRLFNALDRLGNQEPLTAIFPDAEVPIVRIGDDGTRELVKARWGWDRTPRGWVTNARNLDKSWDVIRNVSQRCLVPATSFAEYHPSETIPGAKGNPIKSAAWFRLAGEEDRPPFAFPGFYRLWNWKESGLRRKSDQELADVDAPVLAMTFLTCPPNRVVRPIHPKAMPVILDTQDEFEIWLTAAGDRAAALQRPLPDEKLTIAFIGAKADDLTL